ncbi:hypothetical protein J6590_032830 [Homalodisca vitripennis]|nr:hypothetical protein J6590_032830 [Homalodisca vitripennis]
MATLLEDKRPFEQISQYHLRYLSPNHHTDAYRTRFHCCTSCVLERRILAITTAFALFMERADCVWDRNNKRERRELARYKSRGLNGTAGDLAARLRHKYRHKERSGSCIIQREDISERPKLWIHLSRLMHMNERKSLNLPFLDRSDVLSFRMSATRKGIRKR